MLCTVKRDKGKAAKIMQDTKERLQSQRYASNQYEMFSMKGCNNIIEAAKRGRERVKRKTFSCAKKY